MLNLFNKMLSKGVYIELSSIQKGKARNENKWLDPFVHFLNYRLPNIQARAKKFDREIIQRKV